MIKGQKVKENNMSNYVISCCSTADLTREHMLERNIKYACFHYELDGKEYMDDLGQSMPLPDFYKAMEAGAMTKTSQINQEEYMEYFRQFLDEGYDEAPVYQVQSTRQGLQRRLSRRNTLTERYM